MTVAFASLSFCELYVFLSYSHGGTPSSYRHSILLASDLFFSMNEDIVDIRWVDNSVRMEYPQV